MEIDINIYIKNNYHNKIEYYCFLSKLELFQP